MARERTKSRNWYHNTEILSSRRGCPLPYQGLAGKTPFAYRLPPPAPRNGQQRYAILIRLIPIAKQGCCDFGRPRSGSEKIPNLKAFLPKVPDAFHDGGHDQRSLITSRSGLWRASRACRQATAACAEAPSGASPAYLGDAGRKLCARRHRPADLCPCRHDSDAPPHGFSPVRHYADWHLCPSVRNSRQRSF